MAEFTVICFGISFQSVNACVCVCEIFIEPIYNNSDLLPVTMPISDICLISIIFSYVVGCPTIVIATVVNNLI